MRYLTDRKRAQGMGSAGHGTHHHWQMIVSSIALVVLVPLFVFVFGAGLGGSYEEVLAYFSRPFPAIVTGLALVVGILHLMHEIQVAIEDYVHDLAEKLALVGVQALSYVMIAMVLFALVKLAL